MSHHTREGNPILELVTPREMFRGGTRRHWHARTARGDVPMGGSDVDGGGWEPAAQLLE